MQYTTIILALTAAASAIDIRLRQGGGCQGSYAVCTGMNPNTCCGQTNLRYASVGWVAIPAEWRVQIRAYSGGVCNNLFSIQTLQGQTNGCISEPNGFSSLSGGGWNFVGEKRSEGAAEDCQRPDTVVLDDGTAYAIADLPEETALELIELAFNGTAAKDIPEVFQPLK